MIQAENWFIYALLSLSFYGIWGLASKVATNYIDPKSALIYESIGAVLVSLLLISTQDFKIQSDWRGVLSALLVGAISTLATFYFFLALKSSSASIVVPLTALYPVVTALLALFFLKEPITLRQSIGIFLATASATLFSGK
jgi:transporter family protein